MIEFKNAILGRLLAYNHQGAAGKCRAPRTWQLFAIGIADGAKILGEAALQIE